MGKQPRTKRAEQLLLIAIIIAVPLGQTLADAFVGAPSAPSPGPMETPSVLPFAINWAGFSSMRYQQIYNASLFTNVGSDFIYITTLTFHFQLTPVYGRGAAPWTVTNIQINLSTCTNGADGLNPVFANNVGSDNTVVFGPKSHTFSGGLSGDTQVIPFDRPFHYKPPLGDLLVDIRVFNASGPVNYNFAVPSFDAYASPTDEVSRVWATNVTALSANGSDTTGLLTAIQFSPIPALRIYTSFFGTSTNWVAIEWPTQPTVFVLESSSLSGGSVSWQLLTNAGSGPSAFFQRYYFPVDSTTNSRFYRLVWPSGQ